MSSCRRRAGRGAAEGGGGSSSLFLSASSSCRHANVSPFIISGLTFNGPTSAKPTADITAKQTNGSTPSPTQSSSSCSSSSSVGNKEYSRQLTALNCSVRDWITKHVNDNPLCDLNPIFRDYERHLASIERQYGAVSADGGSEEKKQGGMLPTTATPPPPPSSSSSSSRSGPAAPAPAALFSFGKNTTEDSSRDKSAAAAAPISTGVTFNFGQKVDSSVLGSLGSKTTPPSFSFSSSASSSQTSLFGAPGPAAPLSFSGKKSEDARPAGTPSGDYYYVLKCREEAET